MSPSSRFKLSSRGLLLAAVSAVFAHPALANSGRVDFTAGDVRVTGSDGTARPLVKGNEVKTGDRIVSDSNGRAQIRFSDGSYVSLQPNTDFDIKAYSYNGESDGTEKAFFGMLKGAMRTVTGLVGRKNRGAYQISTPTATIGIRGTGGVISVSADGTTLVQGTSGVWTLTTGGGSLEVPAGKAGAASDSGKAPQQSSQGPSVPAPAGEGGTTQQQEDTYSSGENRSSTGSQAGVIKPEEVKPSTFKPLVTGTGFAIAYAGAEGGSTSSSNINRLAVPRSATFNSLGQMTGFTGQDTTVTSGNPTVTYALAGTHAEFATADGVLAWGRWIGQKNSNSTASTDTYPVNQGLHYVVGTPTPAASLPNGVTYTYNMIGATMPTVTSGTTLAGTLSSATLTGNFSTNQVSTAFAGSIGGMNFSATSSGATITPSTASFSGGSASYTGTLNGCSGSASVQGFFAGTGATHAGFIYQLRDTSLPTSTSSSGASVVGAVALKR